MVYNDQFLKRRRKGLRKNQTDAERIVWNLVRGKKINGYKFFRQYSVGPYILDFYCSELRLSLEIDGGQHNEPARREYDSVRTAYLAGENIRELRFWNSEVMNNLDGVYEKILEHCK